jgi:FkbM family methyltransferase
VDWNPFFGMRDVVGHELSKGHRIAALKRYLCWNIGRRLLSDMQYVIEPVPGAKVILSNHENYATLAYCLKLYDYQEMSFLRDVLGSGEVFGDFGANVGLYSVLAASTGASVLAVEPVPGTYQRLKANWRLNEIQGFAFNGGLGEREETLRFTTDRGGMNKVARSDAVASCEVPVVTADRLAQDSGLFPTIVKIDVEGWELPLLRGARVLLSGCVKAVIIELNGSGLEYGHSDEDVDGYLREAGFATAGYSPQTKTLSVSSAPRSVGMNALYVRRDAFKDLQRCALGRTVAGAGR